MDRKQIEQFTASMAVMLLSLMSVGLIIFFADQFFEWDIFPPNVEKVLGFVMASMLILIVSSVMVNIMINISMIALNSEGFMEYLHKKHERKSKND